MKTSLIALASVSILLQIGCSSESSAPPVVVAGCPADLQVGGVCAGVPSEPLCADAVCSTGGACTTVVTATSDAELQAALPAAQPGTCITLTPGTYGKAVLKPGVSLFGRHPNDVKVARVEVTGADSRVQGLSIVSGGLVAANAPNTKVHAVRFESSSDVGVTMLGTTSMVITQSDIVGSAHYGLQALDSGDLEMKNSLVRTSSGPGLWTQRADACLDGTMVNLNLENVIISDNKLHGLTLIGTHATLKNVRVSDNSEGDGFAPSNGIAAAVCSNVDAKGLNVVDNSGYGVLVDNSTANFGGPSSDEAVEFSRNLRGLWIQKIGSGNPSQTVGIQNAKLLENSGVGLGLDGESRGVIIYGTEIRDTSQKDLPVEFGGLQQIGDGLTWLGLSQARIEGLEVSGSARRSVLIDGPVGNGSVLANVTLSGGDQAIGMLQQDLQAGGQQPTLSGATTLSVSATPDFAIPTAPPAPMAVP